MNDLFSGLNGPQREAVLHERGPLVVFAGAGSGKTRVITHRIAHLVAERNVAPWRILAVTFTNKAAGELRERLDRLLSGPLNGPLNAPRAATAGDLWVGTFHATCARLLRRHGETIGIRRDFVIYDDADQRAMLTRIVRDLGLDERRFPPRLLASVINRAKNEAVSAEAFAAAGQHERALEEIYRSYETRMLASGALDFGDLIFRLVHGFTQSPALLADLQGRFSHVLVDEYQDTNRAQFLLLRALCEHHRNLCVVGDDDQSIYRFRGADRRNILDFTRHFHDAHVVKLEQNYRSTQRILRVANTVVRHNLDREPKTLWTENEEGTKIVVLRCADERDEAAMLVRLIQMLLEAGHSRRDIAVLYRTHAQSRVIEEGLRFANLPYRVVGGLRFYDRAEIKDLLAYLRIAQNPDDDVSLLRVVNVPARGIGKTTVERLLDAAKRDGGSVFAALGRAGDDAAHNAGARKNLARFAELLRELHAMAASGAGPAALGHHVLEHTGYGKALRDENSVEADARLENIQEVLGSMIEFEREAEEPTVGHFLELVTLQTDEDRNKDERDNITLMTVHAAKGLEFPAVLVAGLEEETFPNKRAGSEEDDAADDLEEERRLAYVAFTRARERLFLSYAEARRVYGELRFRKRSRFLDEMPGEDIEHVGARSNRPPAASSYGHGGGAPYSGGARYGGGVTSARNGAPRLASRSSSSSSRSSAADHEPRVDRSEVYDGDGIPLRLGMKVRHQKFGVGQVRAVTPGSPPRVTVSFPGWGEKTLVSSYLEPA